MGSAPKEWWTENGSTRPGPARIRVSVNRDLTEAEREHLRQLGRNIQKTLKDKFRLGPGDRIFVESNDYDSRALYSAVSAVLEGSFVNVFPIAVRTFRERVPAKKGTGGPLPKTVGSTFDRYKAEPVGPNPRGYLHGGFLHGTTTVVNETDKEEPLIKVNIPVPRSSFDQKKLAKMLRKQTKKKAK